jgi:predicted SAM-dependent methyltransferase
MNINLGCGEFLAPGYRNVDRTHSGADYNYDITQGLPAYEPVERIYAGHVLEHLYLPELTGILTRWRTNRFVTPDTQMAVVGPDCDRADALYADGDLDDEDMELIVDGGHRWEGDAHLWRSTEKQTLGVLLAAGWKARPVTPIALACAGWPIVSLAAWQFAILATP